MFYILAIYSRIFCIKKDHNNWLYCFSLASLGLLHYSGFIVAFLTIIFENKSYIKNKIKYLLLTFLVPNAFMLSRLMYSELFQPQSVRHYREMNISQFINILFNVFEEYLYTYITVSAIVLMSLYCIFITKLSFKKIIQDQYILFSTLFVFIFLSSISLIFNVKWIEVHTFIFIFPTVLLLSFFVFTKLSDRISCVIILVLCISCSFKMNNKMKTKFNREDPLVSQIKIKILDSKFRGIVKISCLFHFYDKISTIYSLNLTGAYQNDEFVQACSIDELSAILLNMEKNNKNGLIFPHYYSKDHIELIQKTFYYDKENNIFKNY